MCCSTRAAGAKHEQPKKKNTGVWMRCSVLLHVISKIFFRFSASIASVFFIIFNSVKSVNWQFDWRRFPPFNARPLVLGGGGGGRALCSFVTSFRNSPVVFDVRYFSNNTVWSSFKWRKVPLWLFKIQLFHLSFGPGGTNEYFPKFAQKPNYQNVFHFTVNIIFPLEWSWKWNLSFNGF